MTKKTMTAPGVQLLQRQSIQKAENISRTRVAAYCRISTDSEVQQASLDLQVESFRTVISSHPGWELAGIYADAGFSGTSADKRVEFQRMITDCEAGKIDYIVTKSISRFARNTMDCLQYVRKLKSIGVYVLFDENNLDTSSSSSEMLLSILAAVAQEESHNISENTKWSVRKRFAEGKPKWSPTYGYKNIDGDYIVDEEQAVGVRRIFELYAAGYSMSKIIRTLEAEGIPPPGNKHWYLMSVARVLHNEKYVGDVIMQKSYTVDFLTHKKIRNDMTLVPSYKLNGHHEAIVDRKTFDRVQIILAMKDKHQGCVQYPYYGTLICPLCGAKMVGFHKSGNDYPAAWTCGGEREGVVEIDPFLREASAESVILRRSDCPYYAVQMKYIDRIVRDAYFGLDPEDLEGRAEKLSTSGKAALKALKWKIKDPSLTSIEYIFLDDLVDSISFCTSDNGSIIWAKAVVTWKFGTQSRVSVKYDKSSDLPNKEQAIEGFGCVKNVERHNSSIENSCQNVREQDGRPHSRYRKVGNST